MTDQTASLTYPFPTPCANDPADLVALAQAHNEAQARAAALPPNDYGAYVDADAAQKEAAEAVQHPAAAKRTPYVDWLTASTDSYSTILRVDGTSSYGDVWLALTSLGFERPDRMVALTPDEADRLADMLRLAAAGLRQGQAVQP